MSEERKGEEEGRVLYTRGRRGSAKRQGHVSVGAERVPFPVRDTGRAERIRERGEEGRRRRMCGRRKAGWTKCVGVWWGTTGAHGPGTERRGDLDSRKRGAGPMANWMDRKARRSVVNGVV